jgi:hypothetical protein
LIDRRFSKMGVEEAVVDVAKNFIYSDFTAKNKVGAVVGAFATVGAVGSVGLTVPVAVPIALAVGAMLGAKGEATVKGITKGTISVAVSVAEGNGICSRKCS